MQSPVTAFTRSLKALSGILTKAEAHCVGRKIDPAVMLSSRLFPDMLPFTRQVLIACDYAKGASARMSGTEVPSYEDTETTFAELQVRIQKTLDFIATIPDASFERSEEKIINLKYGSQDFTFAAPVYLNEIALPNFFFHMTTAYNILRHNGVELGKGDFLGS